MAFTLIGLEALDDKIANDHYTWLVQYLPKSMSDREQILARLNPSALKTSITCGFLHIPTSWSGLRAFETAIAAKKAYQTASSVIYKILDSLKKNNKALREEIEAFEEKYNAYLHYLKQRFLLEAIEATYHQIESSQKEILLHFFKQRALPGQTILACLQAHKALTDYCEAIKADLRKQGQSTHAIEQYEILGKRYIDTHFASNSKIGATRRLINSIATFSSTFGLLTGVIAAILGLICFFFPPAAPLLAPIAVVLAWASLGGYVSTLISIVTMSYEALKYKRAPTLSELSATVIDIVISPFYFMAKLIVPGAKELARVIRHLWNKSFSNAFPDVFYTADTLSEIKENIIDPILAIKDKAVEQKRVFENHPSALSSEKIMHSLALADKTPDFIPEPVAKVELARSSFYYLSQQSKICPSSHGSLLWWHRENDWYRNEMDLHKALTDYFALPPDCPIQERNEQLERALTACKTLKEQMAQKRDLKHSRLIGLQVLLKQELQYLKSSEDDKPLLIYHHGP